MNVPHKWRPSLGLLIAVVVGFLVLLPIGALIAARVTSNQLARDTEANLHSQAAIYAALYAKAFAAVEDAPNFGTPVPKELLDRNLRDFHPIAPNLVINNVSILPPRPDPRANTAPFHPAHQAITEALSEVAAAAKKTTLVGVVATDHLGQIVARSGENGGSLLHVEEVAKALSGQINAVARWRVEEYRNHSIRSLSRDTKFRIFVVHPVIVADRVIGTVYLSRTPSNLNKYLFQQRNTFSWLFAAVALSALLMGLFLWRFLTRPIRALSAQAADIAHGTDRDKLPNYGVSEIASLGQSIMDMGASLRKQSAALETYTKHATHELKSPVTSIMAAAELLENPDVKDTRRLTLAAAIKSDAARMDQLLQRMREMVRGQLAFAPEAMDLEKTIQTIEGSFPSLTLCAKGDVAAKLPIPNDALKICLHHILENACEHAATEVTLSFTAATQTLTISDNGEGLSEPNALKATEPFFTTKRDQGGTGLGLAICTEIMGQFNGTLDISGNSYGAQITMVFSKP
jgi:signal transduction histidine kinase